MEKGRFALTSYEPIQVKSRPQTTSYDKTDID
jgi:hypothetical protein